MTDGILRARGRSVKRRALTHHQEQIFKVIVFCTLCSRTVTRSRSSPISPFGSTPHWPSRSGTASRAGRASSACWASGPGRGACMWRCWRSWVCRPSRTWRRCRPRTRAAGWRRSYTVRSRSGWWCCGSRSPPRGGSASAAASCTSPGAGSGAPSRAAPPGWTPAPRQWRWRTPTSARWICWWGAADTSPRRRGCSCLDAGLRSGPSRNPRSWAGRGREPRRSNTSAPNVNTSLDLGGTQTDFTHSFYARITHQEDRLSKDILMELPVCYWPPRDTPVSQLTCAPVEPPQLLKRLLNDDGGRSTPTFWKKNPPRTLWMQINRLFGFREHKQNHFDKIW